MSQHVTLTAYEDGVQKLTVNVPDTDPKFLEQGFQHALIKRVTSGTAADWSFDSWANGDMLTDQFTDTFTRSNAANLGAGWVQVDIGSLSSKSRVNGGRFKVADKVISVGLPLELCTPATSFDQTNQHVQVQYALRVVTNSNPLCLMLRGNQTTLVGYKGYIMQRRLNGTGVFDVSGVGDGPFLEQYEYMIGYYDYDTNTITELANSGELHGVDLDLVGVLPLVMKFTAENVSEEDPVATPEESRTKMYACIREKIAAWASWKFSGQLRGMSVLDNQLVLTIQRGDLIFVETMDLGPARSTRHLDCELVNADLTITVTTGVTKWAFPFDIPADPDYPIRVLNLDTGLEITTLSRTNDGFIEATGDFTAANVAVGLVFPVEWQLSDLYITDPQNDGSVIAFTDGRLQIRYIEFAYEHTGEFSVVVTPNVDDPSQTYTYTFASSGNDGKGVYRVPVLGQNTKAKVVIGGTSARPFNISSFTWTGYLSQKTKRV